VPAQRRRAAEGGPTPATLTVTDAGARRCLELAGDLDLAGVDTVRAALLAELAADRPAVLDLTRLRYLSSVGAGLLLHAVQTAGDDIEVVLPVGGPARRLLDLAGLTDVLGREQPRRPR
jgi:anti-anti-sigma factor